MNRGHRMTHVAHIGAASGSSRRSLTSCGAERFRMTLVDLRDGPVADHILVCADRFMLDSRASGHCGCVGASANSLGDFISMLGGDRTCRELALSQFGHDIYCLTAISDDAMNSG